MTQKPDAVELMTDAELDTAVEVAKSAEVDEYVKTLQWSDDIDDYTKTLIIGNIRGFAFRKTTPETPINAFINGLVGKFSTLTAERDALLREVEAGKNFIGGIYKLLDGHGDCERGCMTCIAMRRIRETYLAALEGESR